MRRSRRTIAKGELAAITNVLENFADTEFKPQLLHMAMDAAQQTKDPVQVATWANEQWITIRTSIAARVTLAETTASQIRENDLDKADNVKKVNELRTRRLDLIKAGGHPPAGIAAGQVARLQKELGRACLGSYRMAAAVNKKPADAVAGYKNAAEADPNSDRGWRGFQELIVENKQYDDAIATADKAMAMPDANPQVKRSLNSKKTIATKLKGAK